MVKNVCRIIAVTTVFHKGVAALMEGQLQSIEKFPLASVGMGIMP